MNPFYKYPLIVVFALVVIGLASLIFRNLPADDAEAGLESGETPVVEAEGAPPPPSQPTLTGRDLPTGGGETAPPSPAVRRLLDTARTKLAQTDLLAARQAAESALRQPGVELYSPVWREAGDIVSRVNTRLFNSDAPAPEKVRYEVKRGDNLVRISRAHNTTVEALIRGAPALDSSDATIYPGMVFNIYRGDWSVVVSKRHLLLVVYDGGRLFKVYNIAIGREGRTPVGTFEVTDKLREPAWTPPGRHIPYGDPDNVLGTRWLGIRPTGDTDPTLRGYGIHGTWEPDSIGSAASQGCVRMLNEEVEELFDIIPVGTPVTIKD